MINTNALSDDHKRQVALFLSNYPKEEGLGIAKRYLNVVTGAGYTGRPLNTQPKPLKAPEKEITRVLNAKKYNRKKTIILGQLCLTPGLTLSEIAAKTGISKKVCEIYLCALLKENLVLTKNDDEFFTVKGDKDD